MSEQSIAASDTYAVPPLIAAYEKQWRKENMLDQWVSKVEGLVQRLSQGRYQEQTRLLLDKVAVEQLDLPELADEELCRRTRVVGAQLRLSGLENHNSLAELLALLSEVSVRSLGLKPHRVQLAGVRVILDGHLAEMATGEGKTLVAGLAAAAAALCGMSVHVVTVNDYLAERDSEYVLPLLAFLRLSVGVVTRESTLDERIEAYASPVCYCTNKELAFDYLKDSGANTSRGRLSKIAFSRLDGTAVDTRRIKALGFAIVDEADSILIDEARTPLILSEGVDNSLSEAVIQQMMDYAQTLESGEHFVVNNLQSVVMLRETGREALQSDFANVTEGPLFLDVLREELLVQALSALHIYRANEHYLVQDEKVSMIDEYTGRIMPDRVWSAGLHQMIEYKESCPLTEPNRTVARMTYQRFFRRYQKLSGMTGTASEVRSEFWNVYGLEVHPIPTHSPCARAVLPDRVFVDKHEKWQFLVERVRQIHETRAPVLVGVRSVSGIRDVCEYFDEAGFIYETLHAADDMREAEIIAAAGQHGKITVATNMAGRGTDIALGTGIEALGGLHVIMTERHDSGRIDRQLMGRCARQGNPGCFQTLQSLEDSLAALIRPAILVQVARYNLRKSRAMLASFVLNWGQRKLEREHSRARERLLKTDQSESELLAFTGQPE
jgi:preprotein translocase subunit SecA